MLVWLCCDYLFSRSLGFLFRSRFKFFSLVLKALHLVFLLLQAVLHAPIQPLRLLVHHDVRQRSLVIVLIIVHMEQQHRKKRGVNE